MFDKRKRKVIIKLFRGNVYINANIALNIRRVLRCTFIFCLAVVLIISILRGDLAVNLKDLLIGIGQSVVVDYLSRK